MKNAMANTDPRGPIRTITSIRETPSETLLTLHCGHVNRANQIFHYKIGHASRCFLCAGHSPLSSYEAASPDRSDFQ